MLYALLVAAAALTTVVSSGPGGIERLGLALLAPAPLLCRRRFPRAALAATAAVVVLAAVRGLDSSVAVTALAIVLVTAVAADRRLRPVPVFLFAASAVGAATMLDGARLGRSVQPAEFVFGTVGTALAIGFGVVLREYRSVIAELADRNAELEQLRRAETHRAVVDERTRIARELHDVVAHHVSAMAVRANAARYVGRERPEEAIAALVYVSGAATETLTALRRMVALLRTDRQPDDDHDGAAGEREEAPLAPQPGLARLPALVQQVRAAGQPVSLHTAGVHPALPAHLDLTAYRIVQEALTNSLRHAPGAQTAVRLDWSPHQLAVSVDNGAPPEGLQRPAVEPGSGHGLLGMRERVALGGGEVSAGPGAAGEGWSVRATIPLPQSASGATWSFAS